VVAKLDTAAAAADYVDCYSLGYVEVEADYGGSECVEDESGSLGYCSFGFVEMIEAGYFV
jgi:hypothetical protein